MNIYFKYRYQRFTVKEFIQFVRSHSKDFINYCEIILDTEGHIYLASPSHQQVLIHFASLNNIDISDCYCSEDLCAKLRYVMVWYNQQSKIYTFPQAVTISLLSQEGIIKNNVRENVNEVI